MLNPLINIGLSGKLFCALLLTISLLNACTTKNTGTGGVIKSIPVEKPATSPVDGTSDQSEEELTETATETPEESLLTESDLGNDVSAAPIRTRTEEVTQTESEFYDNAQSTYQLPPAKARRAQPEASNELKKAYRDVLKEMEKALETNKNFSEALRMFEELEAQYPGFSGPRTNIGMIYIHQQQFEKAAEAFKKALEINDENEFAYSNLALTYRELGKFTEAKESYQKAIELNPNDPLPHYNLGILAELYLRDLPLAVQSFEHYKLANRKKDPEVDNWLIDLNNRIKQQAAAQAALLQATQPTLTLDPETGLPIEQVNGDTNTGSGEQTSTESVESSEAPALETAIEAAVSEEASVENALPETASNPSEQTNPDAGIMETAPAESVTSEVESVLPESSTLIEAIPVEAIPEEVEP